MIELTDIYRHINNQTVAPVELWDPDFCGDIDLEIRRDGRWYYQGSLIARERMVKLFASVLKKEDERYFLVTPVVYIYIYIYTDSEIRMHDGKHIFPNPSILLFIQ